jgi:flagellar L-ring protein FlgH
MRSLVYLTLLVALAVQEAEAKDPTVGPPPVIGPPPSAAPLVYDDRDAFFAPHPPLLARDFAWSVFEKPKPREVKVHDIVTVLVQEAAETNATSRYNRQRNGQYTAQLAQFIRINSKGNLDNAAQNSPEIDGELQSRLQSTGQVTEQESIKFRIAATIVDVLPNGVLVLEARKSIIDNKDLWQYTLTGKIRPQDIDERNSVRSENIAELQTSKKQTGKLHDSTKRGWLIQIYDAIGPF